MVGPGFVGFGPAAVSSSVESHGLLVAARVLAAADVKALSDDECLGVVDDVEVAFRSLAAFRGAVLAEVDARGLCDLRYGSRSRVWFERRHGRSRHSIGRDLRTAKTLKTHLPEIAAALARGEISDERVAFICTKVNDRNAEALAAAQQGLLALSAAEPSFAQFCVLVCDLARYADDDGGHEPPAASNEAHVNPVGDDGDTVAVSATYTGVDAETFQQLVENATNQLWRRWLNDCTQTPELQMPTRTELRAEAMLDLIRRGAATDPDNPRPTVTELSLVVDADRVDELDPIVAAVLDATGTSRFTDGHTHIYLDNSNHRDRASCCGHGARLTAPVTTPDGRRVVMSAGEWEMLVCNADVSEILLDALGTPIAVRDLLRHPTPALRRALIARDGGCAFPGCDAPPGWCDAHHVIHYADDGRTVAINLVLLCRRHHGIVHRTGWSIEFNAERGPDHGHFTITTATGLRMQTQHRPRPPRPPRPPERTPAPA